MTILSANDQAQIEDWQAQLEAQFANHDCRISADDSCVICEDYFTALLGGYLQ